MIKSYLIKLSLSFYMLLAMETNSYAYLDPGRGSFILQMILAFLVSILVFFRSALYKIKELIFKFLNYFKKQKKN